MKKKYAIIGLSGRSGYFTKAILKTFNNNSEIVALLDSNHKRMSVFNEEHSLNIPSYNEKEFEKLLGETKPDTVIVATTDGTHHIYIIEALKHNIDVISEKPMTIDAEKVRDIIAAKKKSSADLRITFNYRYAPIHTKMREMLLDGAIGRLTQIDFNYYLDTFHGASYFKRWNCLENAGGSLLITKACHHFDLVNWWLDQKPVEVFAYGALNYYGKKGPFNPGGEKDARCSTCQNKCMYYLRHSSPGGGSEDEHLVNFNNPGKNELFGAVDGYYGDRCIFGSHVDTWDTFAVTVLYDEGAMMSYSLNASLPYEGYRVAINGTEGRIETDVVHGVGSRLPFPEPAPQNIRYYPLFDGRQTIDVISKGGGHGGGDPVLLNELFNGRNENDRTKRFAGLEAGVMSVLTGVAARRSLKTGKPVKISELLEYQEDAK